MILEEESNLSQMVNNLSNLSELGNYTLNLIETTDTLAPNFQKKQNVNNYQEKPPITDLNQAFTKDSQSDSLIENCNIKYKSFSITMDENSKSTQTTNQKLSTQLTQFPHFEASSISNNSLTSSTQLPRNDREARGKKTTEFSPLKVATSTIQTRSKSSIKVTPLNTMKKATDTKESIIELNKNKKEILAKTIEATLISSDDNDEENSKEISEDESETSLNLKKHKNSNSDQSTNILKLPDVSPVQNIDRTDHLCSIVSNTIHESSENTTSDMMITNENLKEDEQIVLDKDDDEIVTEKNYSCNNGKNLPFF